MERNGRRVLRFGLAGLVTHGAFGCSAASRAAPALRLPIDCEVGSDLWISSRPDADAVAGIRDREGGASAYDGTESAEARRARGRREVRSMVIAESFASKLMYTVGEVPGIELHTYALALTFTRQR